jgi:hypothetical protein
VCAETLNAIVHMQALHHGLVHVKSVASSEEREQVIALLPLTVASPLMSLCSALKGTVHHPLTKKRKFPM